MAKKKKPRTRTIIGIDPGLKGGIAILRGGGEPELYSLERCTERQVLDILRSVDPDRSYAYVEWINPAIPAISKLGMSKLYGSYMALLMALTAVDIPHQTVTPKRWQKALNITKPSQQMKQAKWKSYLLQQAQRRYPRVKLTKATCDALLIAEVCKKEQQ